MQVLVIVFHFSSANDTALGLGPVSVSSVNRAFLFVTWSCLFSWSQFTAVVSTVRGRSISAGPCHCLHSSSTLHTALFTLHTSHCTSTQTIQCILRQQLQSFCGFPKRNHLSVIPLANPGLSVSEDKHKVLSIRPVSSRWDEQFL